MSVKRFGLRTAFVVMLGGLVLAACMPAAPGAKNYLLMFKEQDPGRQAYQTRMIVTPKYLRIDDGHASDDFVLFDRKTRTVYNVVHDDQTILVVKPLPIHLARPKVFKQTVEKTTLEGSPTVDGKTVTRYILRTNGKQCYEVAAAKGLLEEPRRALIEFARALAGQHAVGTALTPKDMRSDCDLADDIFLPARHLQYGFPVRQTDSAGRVRILTDFKRGYVADPKLFKLPANYTRYSPGQMRVGGS